MMLRITVVCLSVFALTTLTAVPAFAGQSNAAASSGSAARIGDPYTLSVDPVTGQSLLQVSKPVTILHKGRELRFANQANADQFKADPAPYLAKVDALMIAQQKPWYPLTRCPVSGEKFGGSMGKPVDFVYGNRLVRFCCKGCAGKFKKNPAKYLATLDAAVIEAQKDHYPLDACPVSSEKLGKKMSDSINRVCGNRLVRFCCKGCVKKFEKNPAKYLAKLNGHANHAGHPTAHDHS